MSAARIRVEIGELVLHGFAAGDRRAIGDAVEAGLTASFVGWNPGARAATRDGVARIDGGSFTVPNGAPGASVGADIARQVMRSVG
jgi:hypothetical protein